MDKYELMIILTNNLSADERKTAIENLKDSMSFAKDLKVNELGHKTFSYPIKKEESGYYLLFNFAADRQSLNSDLYQSFNIDKRILRYMVINETADKKEQLLARQADNQKKIASVKAKREARHAEYLARKERGEEGFGRRSDDRYRNRRNTERSTFSTFDGGEQKKRG